MTIIDQARYQTKPKGQALLLEFEAEYIAQVVVTQGLAEIPANFAKNGIFGGTELSHWRYNVRVYRYLTRLVCVGRR